MVDFSQLLQRPAGVHKRPKALTAAKYPAIIASYEVGDNNKNKTPYCRLNVKLTGWPEGLAEAERMDEAPDGTPVEIDLSKKSFRKDFYLTEDALWRFDRLLTDMGMPADGSVTYMDFLPSIIGSPVLADIIQRMTEDGKDIVNNLDGIEALK